MRIAVMGTGYVGLVAGSCLSDSGNHVQCVDVDKDKVAKLQRGVIPIFEPGLDEIVTRNIKAKRLMFTTDAKEAIGSSKVVFIAVGTPSGEDGSLDLKYVLSAVKTVGECARDNMVVVLKSTVPVGTADKVRAVLKDSRVKFDVVSNPEFLKEGTAVNDFLRPERVVIGCESDEARGLMEDLYAPYVRGGNPVIFMSNRSAEVSKYAANAFLAMKISYINDLALLSERVGANIHEVRSALVTDSRIGNKFLYPGCGYGGSCFPKDVLAMIQLGKENELPLEIFEAVHRINERQKNVLFEKMERHFKKDMKGKSIGLWGLSFKPMTDDMREAPSVTLINSLLAAGAKVRAFDPVAMHEAKKVFGGKIELCDDAYGVIHKADALAILTEWNEFRSPDFNLLKREMVKPVIFDGRNLYDPNSVQLEGFKYYCIGKPDPV